MSDFVALKKALFLAPQGSLRAAGLLRLVLDLVRYGLVSVVALGLDCGLLFLLVNAGLHYQAAAALSFIAGMVVAYFGSIKFVFNGRSSHGHLTEAIGFFTIGMLGLVLNQALLFCFINAGGFSLSIAKPSTAVCVFMFNFIARRSILFSLNTVVAQKWRQVPSNQHVLSIELPTPDSAEHA